VRLRGVNLKGSRLVRPKEGRISKTVESDRTRGSGTATGQRKNSPQRPEGRSCQKVQHIGGHPTFGGEDFNGKDGSGGVVYWRLAYFSQKKSSPQKSPSKGGKGTLQGAERETYNTFHTQRLKKSGKRHIHQ